MTFGFCRTLGRGKRARPFGSKPEKLLKDQGYGFQIKIIGDGPERRRLQAWAQTLEIADRVTFTGFSGRSGAWRPCGSGRSRGIVSPTLIEETAGLTTLEVMMRGKTVMVPDAGGLKEMAGDAGVTFIPGDVTTLGRGPAKRCWINPDLLHPLGERARERAKQPFPTATRMIQDYRQVIQDLSGPASRLKKPA